MKDVKEWIDLISGIVTIPIAITSFFLSYLAFKRDEPQLTFSVALGGVHHGVTLALEHRILYFSIINTGRREVILSSIGGDLSRSGLKRFLDFVPFRMPSRSFILPINAHVDPILRPNGQWRLLKEGEALQIPVPWEEARGLAEEIAKAHRFYIFDSTSRKHKAARRNMSKFRKDLDDWINGRFDS